MKEININIFRFCLITPQVLVFAFNIISFILDFWIAQAACQGILPILFTPFLFSVWNKKIYDTHDRLLKAPFYYKLTYFIGFLLCAAGDVFWIYKDEKTLYFTLSFVCHSVGYCFFIVGSFPRLPLIRKKSWLFSIIMMLCFTLMGHFIMFKKFQKSIGASSVYWTISVLLSILIVCLFNTPEYHKQCRECHNLSIFGVLLIFFANEIDFIDRYGRKIPYEVFVYTSLNSVGQWMLAFSANKWSCSDISKKLDGHYESFDNGFVN